MYSLETFIENHRNLLVITGAGCSAGSGIPTYRNDEGQWQRSDPIQHADFLSKAGSRQRYWARSLAGWPAVDQAEPGLVHRKLAQLEAMGIVSLLVTQNVDCLHQKAGHRRVIDLHGRLDEVVCLGCGEITARSDMQLRLIALNGKNMPVASALTPDGDADIEDEIIQRIQVPDCVRCQGILKPNVVFFGGSVPKPVVNEIYEALNGVSGVLVVGTSLMVFSSFRFCREAHRLGIPVFAVNQGKTRADDLLAGKLELDCHTAFSQLPG